MKMMKTKSYRDLEIFILARELAIKVHKMTLEDLPKFEMYDKEVKSGVHPNRLSHVSSKDSGGGDTRMILCFT